MDVLLARTKLLYAQCSGKYVTTVNEDTYYVEDLDFENVVLVGPKSKDLYSAQELLALPAGDGRAIREVRPLHPVVTTSAKHYTPLKVLRINLANIVQHFLQGHHLPEGEFSNPPDGRTFASNENAGASNLAQQLFKPVNKVLLEHGGQLGALQWQDNALEVESSQQDEHDKKNKPDWNLDTRGANLRVGHYEHKRSATLFLGKGDKVRMGLAVPRLNRTVYYIVPHTVPVDIVKLFRQHKGQHWSRRLFSQVNRYMKTSHVLLALLGCEAGVYLVFRNLRPDDVNSLYCSELFHWMQLQPVTLRQVLYWASFQLVEGGMGRDALERTEEEKEVKRAKADALCAKLAAVVDEGEEGGAEADAEEGNAEEEEDDGERSDEEDADDEDERGGSDEEGGEGTDLDNDDRNGDDGGGATSNCGGSQDTRDLGASSGANGGGKRPRSTGEEPNQPPPKYRTRSQDDHLSEIGSAAESLPDEKGLGIHMRGAESLEMLTPASPLVSVLGDRFEPEVKPRIILLASGSVFLGSTLYAPYLTARYGYKFLGVREIDVRWARGWLTNKMLARRVVEWPSIVLSASHDSRADSTCWNYDLNALKPGSSYGYLVDIEAKSFAAPSVTAILDSAGSFLVHGLLGLNPGFFDGTAKLCEALASNVTAAKFYGGSETLLSLKRLQPVLYTEAKKFSFYTITGDAAHITLTRESRGLLHAKLVTALHLGRLLSRGFVGPVFEGRWANQDVVIKTLRVPAAPSKAETFQQEVYCLKLLSPLWGAHVPRLLAEGLYDVETAVIVLEKVDGRYLTEKDKSLLPQVLEAFRAIHQAGLVHGDVKHDNILITPAEKVVILDFGLSHQAGSAEQEAELEEVRDLVI